jgi:ketosteroid isomerase-like protein
MDRQYTPAGCDDSRMSRADPAEQVRAMWTAQGRGDDDGQEQRVLHGLETHGDCVLARSSLRTFRDGGFVDTQPSWTYFFRDGRLVRSTAYPSRAEALSAIAAFNAEESSKIRSTP